jgi:hypothetical protein
MNKYFYQTNQQQILFPKNCINENLNENHSEYIHRKIELNGYVGVVKYCGKLKHKEDNDIWLGIEWEDVTRGKHNGTVEGVEYFSCSHTTAGSLIKISKVNFGISFEEALEFKYNFIKTEGQNELMSFLNKANENESYIQAGRKKIEIEFVGKEKALEKFSHLDRMQNLDLSFSYFSQVGENIGALIPRVKDLFLEKTLLSKWSQFAKLFSISSLESLNFVDNAFMHFDDEFEKEVANFKGHTALKTVVLNKCKIDFNALQKLSPLLASVETLYLYLNQVNDSTIDKDTDYTQLKANMKNLKFLSLEKNNIKDYGLVIETMSPVNLKALNLNQNHITAFQSNDTIKQMAPNVNFLYLDYNAINDEKIISQLNLFINLTDLDILNNPFVTKTNLEKIKCELIGRLLKLHILNNTDIVKDDRKDYEILYLRNSVSDYLKANSSSTFDMQKFTKYMQEHNPNYFILKKKYFDPLEDLLENINTVHTNTIKGNIMEITFEHNGKQIKKKFPKSTTFYNLKNLLSKLFKLNDNFVFILNEETITDESRTLDSYSINESNIIYLKI